MNNRTLLYIFLACLLVFFGAKFLRKEHTSSFDPVISAVDSTKVDRIRFVSGGPDKEEFELVSSQGAKKSCRTIANCKCDHFSVIRFQCRHDPDKRSFEICRL